MSTIEHALDVGLGIVIIVLCLSTIMFGLVRDSKLNYYDGLADKNTVDVDGTLLASDNIVSKSVHELALALVASAQNRDNIRQLGIVIKHKTDFNSYVFEDSYSLIENYENTYLALNQAMEDYSFNSEYGYLIDSGQFQAFVTSDQSNITCYILVE